MKPLTPKQQRFVEEYLIDLNGKQAAIRTGYSPKTAEVQASRLLSKANVAAAVQRGMEARSRRALVTADEVVLELKKLGFANMLDYIRVDNEGEAYIDLSSVDRDKAAAIQEVTSEVYTDGRGDNARDVKRTKFKLTDKRAALVDLGRHLGLFKDKMEHSGEMQTNIEVRFVSGRAS